MSKQNNLQFSFYNPNAPAATADFLLRLLMEANHAALEQMILAKAGGNDTALSSSDT